MSGTDKPQMRGRTPSLSIVIPCYNESASLKETAVSLVQAFADARVSFELVLVDNGSKDHTGRIIDDLVDSGLPIIKVSIESNQGYGHGILTGLKVCRAPIVGFMHADGQIAAADVVMTYRLMYGREERVLVKARRRFRQDNWKRKVVSIGYNALMLARFGWLGAIDINASPKLVSRRNLDAMQLASKDWFLDAEILLKARALGLRTIEIDVEGRARQGGTSHVRLPTCFEFLRNMLVFRAGLATGSRAPDSASVHTSNGHEPNVAFSKVHVVEQRRHEDSRGYLHKILMGSQVEQNFGPGEVYVTAALPGETKGNHIHYRMGEWFAVVQGDGSLELSDPATGQYLSLPLCQSEPRTVYVPAGIAHAVVNTGEGMLICVAVGEAEHDPLDVIPHQVWPRERPIGAPERAPDGMGRSNSRKLVAEGVQ